MDGVELDLLTGYIQLLGAPLDGDMFLITDGLGNSESFEFDDNNVTNPTNHSITISPIFSDLEPLNAAIEAMGNGTLSTEQENAFVAI